MGSFAGLDFCQKLLEERALLHPIRCDQDQMPFVLWSVPQVPDRSTFIADSSASDPLPLMMQGIHFLNLAGSTVIVIACNTAHHWFSELSRASAVPVLHMVDAAVGQLHRRRLDRAQIGVVGTYGTLSSRLYEERLEASGFKVLKPTESEINDLVWPAILAVKRGRTNEAVDLVSCAYERLFVRGARAIVMACTELPLIEPLRKTQLPMVLVDPTRALAAECVRLHADI
jgi:aspartate racemase